ncbi:MAG: amidohydrolase family protein [Ardenticatenaceae bacterium]
MDWILYNARVKDDGPLVDIGIKEGRVVALEPSLSAKAAEGWDLGGRVVLPGLVDAHTHLDKTYSTLENKSGTLLEAIEVWRRVKRRRTHEDIQATARKALQMALLNGGTAMRSHVDIGVSGGLVALEALLDLREQMRGVIELQLVALGSSGGSPENRAMMEQALMMGADLVGGAPALCADPHGEIDAAFALAERVGKPIDLHIDETEDPEMLTLEYLAEQTIEHGMEGQVTAGHCCSLAFVNADRAARVMDKVAQAQLHIVTLPSCNLVLMGRHIQPPPRGTTRVKELLARGVNVCAASDNVHDPFNPFGSYDLLQIANLNAHTAHMSGETQLYTNLHMVTTHPAKTLGLSNYGLAVGMSADLVVIDAYRLLQAVLSPPARLATLKAGRLVVQTKIERTWHAA